MKTLLKLTWVEMKLFMREPITMIFTLVLPLIFLFVMGGVFGNTPNPKIYSGYGPMDFYTPAYIELVMASIGTIGLPIHLTGYRERGVFRRLRASALTLPTIFGAQVLVSLLLAVLGGLLILALALFVYDIHLPSAWGMITGGFFISLLCFAGIGILLGSLLPTTRSAQVVGLLLFVVMMILSGSGPPREVMTTTMQVIGDFTPLRHTILVIQDPWLGAGWNNKEFLIVTGILILSVGLSLRFFRWE
jgi:ABC-2 type transport system permease protein